MTTLNIFKSLNIYTDDHMPCVSFTYRNKPFSLWWTDAQTIGAFEYQQDPKARTILESLASVLDIMIDSPINTEEDLDSDNDIRYTDYGFLDYE